MSAMGQNATCAHAQPMSDPPAASDIGRAVANKVMLRVCALKRGGGGRRNLLSSVGGHCPLRRQRGGNVGSHKRTSADSVPCPHRTGTREGSTLSPRPTTAASMLRVPCSNSTTAMACGSIRHVLLNFERRRFHIWDVPQGIRTTFR
jgi:hypothetical protein